jgi:uncharacterized protein
MDTLMKSFVVAVCLWYPGAGHVFAEEISREKRADIEQVIELTGVLATGQRMSQGMAAQMAKDMKSRRPDVPQELVDALVEEVNAVVAESLPALKEFTVSRYDKHFTHDEIKELLRFYSTDIGKKVIRTAPALAQETLAFGMQWRQSLVPEIRRRIRERFKKENIEL